MTIEERVQSNTDRIAALEARQPSAHDTAATNPWMRADPDAAPREPIDEDFQRVFGFWHDQNKHRRFQPGSEAESIWLTKQQHFGGIVPMANWPEGMLSGVERLVEHYAAANPAPIEAVPELIEYNGQHYLVFPEIPGAGYGTPYVLMVGIRTFLQDSIDKAVDRTIELIEKRRAKA